MKKMILPSKFETQVWLTDKYGDRIVQLVPDGNGYYKFADMPRIKFDIGDEFYVEEQEVEVD